MPKEGFFFATPSDLEVVEKNYGGQYTFNILTSSERIIHEVRRPVLLCSFLRIE